MMILLSLIHICPLIGIITKIDSPYANIPMVRQWLINAGCERIFMVNNVTREGIDELMEYLQEDTPKLTLEQAKFKQILGLNEWDPLPCLLYTSRCV